MGVFDFCHGKSTEPTGCPDVPIADIKDDRFNVGQYINGLSSFILTCDTPMTVSIQGDWGSGKTSMMNMVEANIRNLALPIWFNTWQFSQFSLGNSLAISMMEVLLQRLDGDLNILGKIAGGIKGLAKNAILTAAEMTAGSRVADKIEQATDSATATGYVSEILALKEQFQKAVNTKLEETMRQRVVVFVDDLDRLHPAKAVELLEVLKLFLDCENCVFVLAVDYEVVTMGIKQKYGSEVDAHKGRSFFDKIIQLPFKMPVAQYDIAVYVQNIMERLKVDTDDANVSLFTSLIKTSIGLNPRSMKRLFNTFQLLNIITESVIHHIPDKLRQRILFATVCMQMRYDVLYNYMAAGNASIDNLRALSSVDAHTIKHFVEHQENTADTQEDDNITDFAILEEIFDRVDLSAELTRLLQELPNFLEYFLLTVKDDPAAEFSETNTHYLRDILRCSAVTSVGGEDIGDAAEQAWGNRSRNRSLVQSVNEQLSDLPTQFSVYQSRQRNDGIISSRAAGYTMINRNGKEYKLEYDVDNCNRFGLSVTICLQGYSYGSKKHHQQFYEIFGENPLAYDSPPTKEDWAWYIYENMLRINERDANAPYQIANIVRDAYARFEKVLAGVKAESEEMP